MPRLAGQREAYLMKSFREYQAGTRVGTQAAMAEAVRGLDDATFADLSHYLAHFRRELSSRTRAVRASRDPAEYCGAGSPIASADASASGMTIALKPPPHPAA